MIHFYRANRLKVCGNCTFRNCGNFDILLGVLIIMFMFHIKNVLTFPYLLFDGLINLRFGFALKFCWWYFKVSKPSATDKQFGCLVSIRYNIYFFCGATIDLFSGLFKFFVGATIDLFSGLFKFFVGATIDLFSGLFKFFVVLLLIFSVVFLSFLWCYY